MAKPVILIAEDDLFLHQIYRHSLEAAGYTVEIALNGKELLAKLDATKIDLLLLDLNMPEVSGTEVLEKLNADGRIKTLPVIVLTNYSEDEYVKKSMELGVKAFFTKSNLSFDTILERIRVLLKIRTDAPNQQSAPAAAAGDAKASGTPRVLVVEDDPFLLEIYKQNLKERGYDVSSATGGKEALDLLSRDKNWNVMLLDLLMPEVDGFTVLERLKEKGMAGVIPTIVLTNLSQESDQKKALELGAVDFAVKSELSFDEIVARVEGAMKKSKKT